ncbi:UDP-glucose 4-epimerase GalE [Emcibacteraceae bacterium]|jgi:UDP-glucose 4-epimerase|nr:UDP-glucose 4-epimerase GalE [Emcibacteraceae bacterium]
MKILVCGGAGYIGSHMVKLLASSGYDVVTFDNLSSGHREAVKWGRLIEGDLLNPNDLENVFLNNEFDLVMHFSAKSIVPESMENPSLYYNNNIVGTINLLDMMVKYDVKKFIFSSTAATYGIPETSEIPEEHKTVPINPYGHSKLMVEQILQRYYEAYRLSSVTFRYFNAAGADPEGDIGENHDPETHLIPNILKSLLEDNASLKVFGDDYATPDGTCVRDYVHVNDLAAAHLLGANYLHDKTGAHLFNLGSGSGYSVLEVIKAAEVAVGKPISYSVEQRRAGDPDTLIANSTKARTILGWKPDFDNINDIVGTAWKWHSAKG